MDIFLEMSFSGFEGAEFVVLQVGHISLLAAQTAIRSPGNALERHLDKRKRRLVFASACGAISHFLVSKQCGVNASIYQYDVSIGPIYLRTKLISEAI